MVFSFPLHCFGLIGSAIAHRSNPFFIQKRTGKGGVPFNLYKIKSMRDATAKTTNSDEARLTRFGIFLRRTSIDELPQLFNILRGEMSFVGPRPQIHEYYELVTPEERRRYDVIPGLSGWSQVNGRNDITWRERFRQDVWYVDHASLKLDFLIMLKTVSIVLWGRGVSNANASTMPCLKDELREESSAKAAMPVMPKILRNIRENNPDSVISFSFHDADQLHPTALDPHHLFALTMNESEDIKSYRNFFFDVWRCPNGSVTAFPLGIVGPFDVKLASGTVEIVQQDGASLRRNNDKQVLKILAG